MSAVAVVGIGQVPFGRHPQTPGIELGAAACRAALADAGVDWPQVGFAAGGSMTSGNPDSLVARLGLTGIAFQNVFNGCATGGSALASACAVLASGQAELALVVGFDKHERGTFALDPGDWGLGAWYGRAGLMVGPQFFAMKTQRYMYDHAISAATLARVVVRARRNGSVNPLAWRRDPVTEEEVLGSPMVADPLRQYMLCSPGAGAVAVVLATAGRARTLDRRPVYLRSVAFRTRRYGSFEAFSPSLPDQITTSVTADAARAAFEAAGVAPGEVGVVQVQDTDAGTELINLAEAGLCEHGEQESLVRQGETDLGGRLPVNTDGGCLANGEPVGASGLRQVYEVTLQLRGEAGTRQVAGPPTVGFTHVYGAPGVSACAVLSR